MISRVKKYNFPLEFIETVKRELDECVDFERILELLEKGDSFGINLIGKLQDPEIDKEEYISGVQSNDLMERFQKNFRIAGYAKGLIEWWKRDNKGWLVKPNNSDL